MPTKIEWTNETWNPITGCTPISEGCKFCYARRMARRLAGRCGYPEAPHHFDVTLHPERLDQPLRWRKPRRVFPCSMSDLFHPAVPFTFIGQVFDMMYNVPQHTYQVLTKRSQRMKAFIEANETWYASPVPDNIWLGISAENQKRFDERWQYLRNIEAEIHFVGLEPLLGPVVLPKEFLHRYAGTWCIIGGESGPGARPMRPDWARSLRDQCQAAGVPFFFKQWGAWFPRDQWEHNPELVLPDDDVSYYHDPKAGIYLAECDDGAVPLHRVGKKAAGHLLDGREHHEFPRTSVDSTPIP